jgi:hypothetical protein
MSINLAVCGFFVFTAWDHCHIDKRVPTCYD